MTVTAYDLRNRLGEHLDRAIAGDAIGITRHGRQVAVLVSVARWDKDSKQAEQWRARRGQRVVFEESPADPRRPEAKS